MLLHVRFQQTIQPDHADFDHLFASDVDVQTLRL